MAITDAPPLEVGASKRAGGGRRGDRPSGRRQRLTGRRSTPWLFLAVPLAFLVVLTYIPVANMFWYSVTDWDGLDPDKTFVGLENYVEIFTRPEIFQVFFVSLFYLAGAVAQLGLALFFATLLSFQTRFRNFFKGVIFFPYLINGVAIGLMFLYFFRPDGTLDAVLGAFGVQDTPQWLGDPSVVNVSLAATSVWRYMGLNFVLFLGAIQSVPEEQYEAADIDGATSFDKFRYIIVPSIRRILGLSFILAIAGALSAFEMPYIMTGGANGSETFVIQTVDTAFRYSKVGLASAMAVVLLAIVLIITAVQRRVFPDEKAGQE
ncbi:MULTISPECIES: carbohydrate ABC transporter permease [Rathayibacter]|uniref:ABC transporter permease n=1 Tax=Rathayibacter festucae DSM 15932 TaxID=1328866 RepID=A0A3T0T4L9_9MICO|nr:MULTISPECIES: sugar ABC transporter permease [Rathayibacter]AZZ53495.1 ABC transporter permease [Rathayibacter festucae DSM 15932]MCJ1673658.1 sugar ABC transporter permease [Rathayibacter sp. VKM Ac-2929]MCJ1683348.1 sugar ABC transporter permease [Rathayibacter sp. VKM Ac-2928]MCJ1688234.1 sugar ABC transporter permease [Rathayibacter sp. VKM Ac-2927]MCJ1698351.1 sugar ABC transporter permease [Rathayibacter festucae]